MVFSKINGIKKEGFSEYLGIPFALPPVGTLAFKKPVSVPEISEEFYAVEGRSNPVQRQNKRSAKYNSQDCLYLNIWVPDHDKDNKLPVMVYFYGGSYASGGSGKDGEEPDRVRLDMSRFACETGTVAVTFNYRLNLYGFSYMTGVDSNIGIYDQLMVLEWVKNHIEYFGGDSENITLFGQSAGAASILAIAGMPDRQHLFSKMILQSPCVEHFHTVKEAEVITNQFLKFLKVPYVNATQDDIGRAYKKLSIWLYMKGDIRCAFSPVIDGELITDYPEKTCLSCTKPMLIGSNLNEANIFAHKIPTVIMRYFEKKLGLSIDGKNYREGFMQALTDYLYFNPASRILEKYRGPSFRYKYVFTPIENISDGTGCYHGSELEMLFGSNEHGHPEVGKALREIWSSFAYTGNAGFEEAIHVIGDVTDS